MVTWREVARNGYVVAHAAGAVVLLLEAARGGTRAPDLADVIARLAPHVAFEPVVVRGDFIERSAVIGDERLRIGRYDRGVVSIAYLLAAPANAATDITVDSFVAVHLSDMISPFDHFAD